MPEGFPAPSGRWVCEMGDWGYLNDATGVFTPLACNVLPEGEEEAARMARARQRPPAPPGNRGRTSGVANRAVRSAPLLTRRRRRAAVSSLSLPPQREAGADVPDVELVDGQFWVFCYGGPGRLAGVVEPEGSEDELELILGEGKGDGGGKGGGGGGEEEEEEDGGAGGRRGRGGAGGDGDW